MKLRAPAIPLITVDPYFSVWATNERLNYSKTVHWTGKPQSIIGNLLIDGAKFSFLGFDHTAKKMRQTDLNISALSTSYTFEGGGIRLLVKFTTPLLPDDLDVLTRPVSYMSLCYESTDGNTHEVIADISADEALCLNEPRQCPVAYEPISIEGISGMRIGSTDQGVLLKSGDDIRIDWGYFYLAVQGCAEVSGIDGYFKKISVKSTLAENSELLYLFAYDDVRSINYFGEHLPSYWNRNGMTVEEAISAAARDYKEISERCDEFSSGLFADASMVGGEKYAELLSLAYRQAFAAHKVAVEKNGELLFISKECFSNGCAATVDVSYPSTPLFLLYNTELVKGMLRPIYRYAESPEWEFDFAPHDVGQYPILAGQRYGLDKNGRLLHDMQMPVEECGNMIIMEANIALADGNADFASKHLPLLRNWCKYLIQYGDDPENQLCTDDFAGHLAHNCNLSLKAIIGIAGMSIIEEMSGNCDEADKYMAIAKEKAENWVIRAKNTDGSYRLAFDMPDSFSLKYNMIWDKLWGTELFSDEVYIGEISRYLREMREYGVPLDSRADYTKADWYLWCAAMIDDREEFKRFITPTWNAYNVSPSRVPLTDWYDLSSAMHINFLNRSVVGGLFIRLMKNQEKAPIES